MMPTPSDFQHIFAVAAERNRLRKINAELLEALQTLIDAIGGELGGTDTPDMTDAINAASAAIAKATADGA